MSSSANSHSKTNSLEIIKNYRVSELQALLDHASLPRQGQKRDLFQRCKILINTSFTPQLANKIHQINNTRIRSSRSHHVSSSSSSSSRHPIVLPKTPPLEILPPSNQIQFVSLPFFDKMRTIESSNMPVDWNTFSPLRFTLNETDIDLIRKNTAKVFLRIAPTIVNERQNDVLPPYLFVQFNNQAVISNNVSKTVGSQAHSMAFPTDITDKIMPRANMSNTLSFLWLQSPTNGAFKNLPKSYTLAVQLVHCVSLQTLFEIVVKREPYSAKTDADSDIEVEDLGLMATRHRVSLLCPITQSLIVVPTKSAFCSHMTCFDLKAFLQMNERRLQWTCPLCKKSAAFDSLRVDQRLQVVMANVPSNCSTVEIDSSSKLSNDCQYILDCVKQEKIEMPETTHAHGNYEPESTHNSSTKSRRQSADSDCIVLSSGSESERDDDDGDEERDGGGEVEEEEGELQQDTTDRNPDRDHSPLPVTSGCQQRLGDARERDQLNGKTAPSPKTTSSTPSPTDSTAGDANYWDEIAQITYDLSSEENDKVSQRKRSHSSVSSVLSTTSPPSPSSSSASSSLRSHGERTSRKRRKHSPHAQSRTDNIEVITLSSSDSSSLEDQLS